MNLSSLLSGWMRAPVGRAVPADRGEPAVRSLSRTHVGHVRAINEDRVLDQPGAGLWAIADGMGGHAAGDLAAEIVVETLRQLAERGSPLDDAMIERALGDAGRRIHAISRQSGATSGSTVAALHIDGARGMLFWAGDSRIYRLRGRRLERLTRDHSVVQELIDAGALLPEQAERHPDAHIITRALGTAPGTAVERREIETAEGDLYLLCSDGLFRDGLEPDGSDLAAATLEVIADRLVERALAAGGRDNISLVLVAVGPSELSKARDGG